MTISILMLQIFSATVLSTRNLDLPEDGQYLRPKYDEALINIQIKVEQC
jgi:hypothetical protein